VNREPAQVRPKKSRLIFLPFYKKVTNPLSKGYNFVTFDTCPCARLIRFGKKENSLSGSSAQGVNFFAKALTANSPDLLC
jgi:hypothetical protein